MSHIILCDTRACIKALKSDPIAIVKCREGLSDRNTQPQSSCILLRPG